MRGRKPVPSRIKDLAGNPGKRPFNVAEPRPKIVMPECPVHLAGAARQEWDRLSHELSTLRLLTNLDRAALASYCVSYGLWVEATEAIQKYGAVVKSPKGYPIQSPYVSIANRQAELMMRYASEFGFTPASRSRIKTQPVEHPGLFDLTS